MPHGLEDANCVTVNDWGPIHLTKNCDSEEFQYLARDPALMLTEERKTRQNRPLYPALGWLIAAPIRLSGLESLGARVLGRQDAGDSGPAPGRYFPEYVAFIIINLVLLAVSVIILLRLLGARSVFETAALLSASMLLINEVTKAFFWTPHQQIFNVFVPVMSIYLYRWMQTRLPAIQWTTISAAGIALGVASLAYGVFAVSAAGAVLCLVLGERLHSSRRLFWLRALDSTLLLAAFFAPVLAWTAFVIARTGSFYSQEIDLFRQFVWMIDSLRSEGLHGLASDMITRLRAFSETFMAVIWFPLLILTAVTVARHSRSPDATAASGPRGNTRDAVIWFLAADVTFFALLGTYETRLSWSVVPALVVLIGLEIASFGKSLSVRGRRVLRAATIVIAVCHAGYWILRAGPYS